MKITKYPDGTSYVHNISNDPITFRVNSYEDLWHLNQYVDLFNHKFGFKPNVIIPNLIDAQADRRFGEQSSGLKLVLRFLNSLPVKNYYIFHPHNPEAVEMGLDNVVIQDNTELLVEVLEQTGRNLDIMSPDAGAYKWITKSADKVGFKNQIYTASKSRTYYSGKSTLTQQIDTVDFGGRDILVIDDICVGGGTFIGLADILRKKNVGNLYLMVSHMTVQNFKVKALFDRYDKVFTTNSKFDNYFVPDRKGEAVQPENLVILKHF